MRNHRLTLEYEGTRYFGWQRQPSHVTVQQVVEDGLERITGAPTTVHASGRTDTGVHAEAQVASFRSATALPPERLMAALNAVLPDDVAVLDLVEAPPDFHARFSARGKAYRYRVWNGRHRRVQDRTRRIHERRRLDVGAMARAASLWVGEHDFASFHAAGRDVESTVRIVRRFVVERAGDEVRFEVEASGFLYKMVRTMVGTLLEIGRGERDPMAARTVLDARDRTVAGPTAPALGLALVVVSYDSDSTPLTPLERASTMPAPMRRTGGPSRKEASP